MEKANTVNFWRFVKRNLAVILIVACAISATLVAVIIKSKNLNELPQDVIIDAGVDTGTGTATTTATAATTMTRAR